MDTYKTQVVKIEPQQNDKGTEYLLVTTSKKDRMGAETLKQKKIYDFDMQEVLAAGPGTYNFSYEKQPDGVYFLTGIAALDESEPTKPVAKPVPMASKQPIKAPTSVQSLNKAPESNKDRQIAAAVLLKATVEFMAIHEAPITEAPAYFKALAEVYEAYIAEPAKLAAAVKELETEVPF
jgi:hypothetical protein